LNLLYCKTKIKKITINLVEKIKLLTMQSITEFFYCFKSMFIKESKNSKTYEVIALIVAFKDTVHQYLFSELIKFEEK